MCSADRASGPWGGQSEGMTTLGSHLLTSLGGRKPWGHGTRPGGSPKILVSGLGTEGGCGQS